MGLVRANVGGALVLVALSAVGCAEEKATLGEECRRNDDCYSHYCVVEKCQNPPPRIDPSLLPQQPAAPAPVDAGSADAARD
jgi:hypothetical protein